MINLPKLILNGFAVAVSLMATSSGALAATLSGDLFYTRASTDPTNPASLKKVGFTYDEVARTFSLGTRIPIAITNWGDGVVFALDGDLIVGAGDKVHKVNPNTGTVTTASTAGTSALHLALDPSGQKVWGGSEGPIGTNIPLAEIPLNGSFNSAIPRPLTGDDLFITSIAFDNSGQAYYTAGGDNVNGSFGIIDLNTFTTKRLYSNLPDAHGMVFDPFTLALILFRGNHISQIDVKTGELSDRAFPDSIEFDGGTVDGKGHLFVADGAGDNLVFMDYSSTRKVGDASNFVATPFLDSHIDDIAPMSGPGSEPVPEPTTVLGTLAFGAVISRWRMKRKQQQKVLNSTVS